jgi:hypothetical protein
MLSELSRRTITRWQWAGWHGSGPDGKAATIEAMRHRLTAEQSSSNNVAEYSLAATFSFSFIFCVKEHNYGGICLIFVS